MEFHLQYAAGFDAHVFIDQKKIPKGLRRNFGMIEIFGIAFSITGLLPSIASVLAFSIPAGPAGMVWVRNTDV